MKKILYLLLFMLIAIACEEREGYGVLIKWEPDIKISENTKTEGTVCIPSNGGTYTFTCINHNDICIKAIQIDGKEYIGYDLSLVDNEQHIEGSFFEAKILKNVMTLSFNTNKTSSPRSLKVFVVARSNFYDFTFHQAEKDK